jgi:hypothetical protein
MRHLFFSTLFFSTLFLACASSDSTDGGDDSATPVDWGHHQSTSAGWISIATGFDHTCAIDASGLLNCWGKAGTEAREDPLSPPEGQFLDLDASMEFACALDLDQKAQCWGDSTFGKTTAPPGARSKKSRAAITLCAPWTTRATPLAGVLISQSSRLHPVDLSQHYPPRAIAPVP